ncbi:MAG: MHS family MFS transporter [Gemmataceae bacterium]|nr:MHS family MFS transporter [Gemmataceae bacterium]
MSTHEQADPARERRAVLEAIVASTVGTTIEWYDFFLYGTVAALVFPRLFFPDFDPVTGLFLAFGTFTAGFLARPVGGVIFGYLGDRVGRKSSLVATLLLMGVSTCLIGVLPTYKQIGILAPLLLTLLRVLQGIGVGGEWGGAVLLALESGHRGKRGLYASWPQAGVPLGLLASTGAVALFEGLLSEEDFLAWGWRVPFAFSALLILVGLLIRTRITETPLFRQLQQTDRVASAPVSEVIRRHWREILLAAGARVVENASFYLFTAYALAYARQELQVDPGVVLLAVNVAAAVEFFTIPLFGVLSDYRSRRGVYAFGCIFLIFFAWPYYELLATRSPVWIVVATVIALGIGHASLYAVQASLIPELFGTRLRYSGASIGSQLAAPLAGGLAPLIATALLQLAPGQRWPLAAYIALLALVSLACVLRLAETSRRSLEERMYGPGEDGAFCSKEDAR